MDIRTKFNQLLKDSGFSIRALSQKSGVRRQTIMRFLAGGNIHILNLEKLLSSLGQEVVFRTSVRPVSELKGRLNFDEKALKKFCRKNSIKYLAVFGSVLRDDFGKDSDIDVLIELKKPVSFFKFDEIEGGLKKIFKTSHKLDLVTQNSISPLIASEINNTSEVLYEEAA